MALPTGPYQGQDLTDYQAGNKFLPRQFYSLNSPIQTNTLENTGGITGTPATGSYMGYPSYEAWLLAQGGGGGGGGRDDPNPGNRYDPNQNLGTTNITDYEADAADVGSTWAGSWAKAKDDFSNLPLPMNLLRKGIRHWKERRDIKRAEKQQADKDAKDFADAAAPGIGRDIGGGWTQTNTGGGGATFTGGGGQTHQGFSNTPAGFAAAAESEGSFAQGGRIGYERGRVVNPGGYQGDIEIPEGFLKGLPNEDYQKMIEELMKQKRHEELMRELGPFQWAAEGGLIGYSDGGIVRLL